VVAEGARAVHFLGFDVRKFEVEVDCFCTADSSAALLRGRFRSTSADFAVRVLRGHRLIGDAERLSSGRVAFVDPAEFGYRESHFLWHFTQSESARVVDVEERM
jgi:hypothetical protein